MTRDIQAVLEVGTHGRWEDGDNHIYKAGDEILLSPDEARALHGRIRIVRNAQAAAPAPAEAEAAETDVSLLAGNVGQVALAVSQIDDLDTLVALAEAEAEGQDRKGALRAINQRVAELEAEADEADD